MNHLYKSVGIRVEFRCTQGKFTNILLCMLHIQGFIFSVYFLWYSWMQDRYLIKYIIKWYLITHPWQNFTDQKLQMRKKHLGCIIIRVIAKHQCVYSLCWQSPAFIQQICESHNRVPFRWLWRAQTQIHEGSLTPLMPTRSFWLATKSQGHTCS